ncbi:MAG: hypothetical protein ABI606_18075 [Rhodoferax sp.]
MLIAILLGSLLHVYTVAFRSEGGPSLFLAGLLVFSLLPYGAAFVLSRMRVRKALATGFAVGALAGDVYAYYAVFVAPKSSTAALALLVIPIWNLLLLGPTGLVLAWVVATLIKARSHKNAT